MNIKPKSEKTPLLLVKDHPSLQEIIDRAANRSQFLQKRFKEVSQDLDELHAKHWDEVYDYIQELGIREKDYDSLSIVDGVLFGNR